MKRGKKRAIARNPAVFRHEDHRLVTRRDFLAAGLIQFSAAVTAPTLLAALLRSREAYAACPTAGGSGGPALPSFIQLNLAGGASLGAAFVPRDQGGALIPSMSLMGLGNTSALALEDGFGAAGAFFNSGVDAAGAAASFVNGLRSAMAASTQANTAAVAVVARTRDDTNLNRLDVTGLAAAAGLVGPLLPNLSTSGFGQSPTLLKPPPPLNVNSYDDVRAAIGVAGPLGTLAVPAQEAVFRLVNKLSESEAARLLSLNVRSGGELQELIGCATTANVAVPTQALPATDPRTSALATLWNLTAASSPGSQDVVLSSIALNAILGHCGPARINLGGYDYHDNTRTGGNSRDNAAGVVAGRLLESAALLGKPLFLYVSTDGACRSADSAANTAPWVSDRGQAGVTIILAYHPAGRPATGVRAGTGQVAVHAQQIGWLTAGQAADDNYTSGWSDERAGVAVLANYLNWALGPTAGATAYNQVISPANGLTNPFTAAELNRILRFG